jgi:predicted oxidoreductase
VSVAAVLVIDQENRGTPGRQAFWALGGQRFWSVGGCIFCGRAAGRALGRRLEARASARVSPA